MLGFFKRSPYRIRPNRPSARLSIVCMVLCMVIRCIYFALQDKTPLPVLIVHLVLPVAAAVLLILVVLFWGREHVALSSVSVLLGVIFFIVKATTFESRLHTVLCIMLYSLVLLLFSATVFGLIPTKKLLYPLFGLPLLYHIFVEDMQIYILADPRPPFVEWLPEISVLLIMGALLSFSIGLEKKK